MFIALIGPPCAGKRAVAQYLEQNLNFRRTFLTGASHHAHSAFDAAPSESHAAVDHPQDELVFDTSDALLEYATVHWREPLLTLDLASEYDIKAFLKRPFFILLGVQAPLSVRWQRYQDKYGSRQNRARTLEQFIALDDGLVYGSGDFEASQLSTIPQKLVKMSLQSAQIVGDLVTAPLTPPASNASATSDALDRSMSSRLSISSSTSSTPAPLSLLFPKAALILTNTYPDIDSLHASLHDLRLPETLPTFLRPAWDHYFLSLCSLASLRSNCMKRRVGAVLVRSNRVLSTGYNGTPRGMKNCNEGGCARCNGGAPGGARLDECLCLHAEENALLECGRERGGAEGTVLYCNTCPCLRCAVKIVQTGVREVVYELDYSMDDRSRQIFEEAKIKFRKVTMPTVHH
ncbi:Deoxycytidine monophosphate (dCMP) deaminase [Tilletia horrida]|nr:Deoxycytidine monophosphate (dCMP) deaminase [Tilletia horrida]KAK0570052.1 Deoxycytidine monophosphate (dCMP) deaminase [Tilletia horrida]